MKASEAADTDAEAEDKDGYVWLLTVKGNLRHRIEKFGIELPCDAELTEPQSRLRKVAIAQQFDGKLGRPDWANDAFVFVTVAHAASIQDTMQEWCTKEGKKLKCKYVIVSESLEDLLLEVLSAQPPAGTTGKEAFQFNRSGQVDARATVRIKMRSMEEVENTTLKELEAALEREARQQGLDAGAPQPDERPRPAVEAETNVEVTAPGRGWASWSGSSALAWRERMTWDGTVTSQGDSWGRSAIAQGLSWGESWNDWGKSWGDWRKSWGDWDDGWGGGAFVSYEYRKGESWGLPKRPLPMRTCQGGQRDELHQVRPSPWRAPSRRR